MYALSILFSALIIGGAWIYTEGVKGIKNTLAYPIANQTGKIGQSATDSNSEVIIPVRWGDLGEKMIEAGVIDADKFEALYENSGGLSQADRNLLRGRQNRQVKINSQNSGYALNLLWALGLGNKNDILEKGGASDSRRGAGNFASTAGWTLTKGDAMDHYSRHPFIILTPAEQQIVERVSKNIYRPCCDNPTDFPDCNHGMAILGLLELMASQGVSESDMYKAALQVNAYWFPDEYANIGKYLESKSIQPEKVSAKDVLGKNFSSASGYQKILSQLTAPTEEKGGSCGV